MRTKWHLAVAGAGLLGLALFARPAHVSADVIVSGTPVSASCSTGDPLSEWPGHDGCTLKFYSNGSNKCLFVYDIVLANNQSIPSTFKIIAGHEESHDRTIAFFTLQGGEVLHQGFEAPIIIGSARDSSKFWDGGLDISIDETQLTSFVVTGVVGTCPDNSDNHWLDH